MSMNKIKNIAIIAQVDVTNLFIGSQRKKRFAPSKPTDGNSGKASHSRVSPVLNNFLYGRDTKFPLRRARRQSRPRSRLDRPIPRQRALDYNHILLKSFIY